MIKTLTVVAALSFGLSSAAFAQTSYDMNGSANRADVQQNMSGAGGNIPPKPAASGSVDPYSTGSVTPGSAVGSTGAYGSRAGCAPGGEPGDAANSGNLPNLTGETAQGTGC